MRFNKFTPAVASTLIVMSTELLTPHALASDCTYDQLHQMKVVDAVAAAFPGGTTDYARGLVSWTDPTDGTTTFGFGGCADFGSMVTRATALDAPRTRDEVFAVARELATRYWDNEVVSAGAAARALITSLVNGQFDVESGADGETFLVQEPGYVHIYVQHRFGDGTDQVSIGWQAAF